jgi:hypothetical protein
LWRRISASVFCSLGIGCQPQNNMSSSLVGCQSLKGQVLVPV